MRTKCRSLAVDFVEQEPIRFNVAVPMMFPVAAKRVVLVSRPTIPPIALEKTFWQSSHC